MNTKTKLSLFLFFIILIFSLSSAYAYDEYDNGISQIKIYKYDTSVKSLAQTFTSNPTTTNITLESVMSLKFEIDHILNYTFQPDYYQVSNTTGIGIQLISDTEDSYQTGLFISTPYENDGNYWNLTSLTPIVNVDADEIIYGNVTQWINYNNGSGWLLSESWKFNFVIDEPYTPPTYTDDEIEDIGLTPFLFWGMVGCGALTPLCFVASIRLHDGKYIGWGIMSLVGFLAFLGMLTGISLI